MLEISAKSRHHGFTIIELLIVIVIIGILAGIVLVVINPAKQQRKASESILKANTNKLCLGLYSCTSTTATATNCGSNTIATTLALIGATSPTAPATATYASALSGNVVTLTGTLPYTGGSETANVDCSYSCSYDFSTGIASAVVALSSATSNCW